MLDRSAPYPVVFSGKRRGMSALLSVSPIRCYTERPPAPNEEGRGGCNGRLHTPILSTCSPATCRAHFSGLLGGAAVAWALGPQYVQVQGPPSRSDDCLSDAVEREDKMRSCGKVPV